MLAKHLAYYEYTWAFFIIHLYYLKLKKNQKRLFKNAYDAQIALVMCS